MSNENTSLKNITPGGDSNTTNEMVIGKINTYQRSFLIVTGSLLALLVLIAVAGTSGGQHLQSSAHETTEGGADALAEYPVDFANLALTKDIFGVGTISENVEGEIWNRIKKFIWISLILFHLYSLTYNLCIFPSFIDIPSRVSVFI